jgi:ABC-type Fe3+ transport system permease subunit
VLDVWLFCRVALRIALPGVWSAALSAFLALFDELLILMFFATVRAQTLTVRIGTITAIRAFPKRSDDPHSEHRSRPAAPTGTTARRRLAAESQPFATKRRRGAWLIRA